MPEPTKIIPFPSRAKPRVLPTKPRVVEFVELSEIIRDNRSGDTIKGLVLAADAADGMVPNVLTWPRRQAESQNPMEDQTWR
ncbi:MAG: hypothetical protein KKH72_13220 [Alphaproteobacteria bacterium]|nr:hypothetical protein [Alphaproteobacteria bacterium]